MAENEQDSTLNTVSDQKQKNQEDKQKREQENKPKFNIISFIFKHFGIIWKVSLIIFVILFIIGILQILNTMPGMILGKIKEFAGNIIGSTIGWFTGDNISAKISKEEELEIAQYVQDMGYDLLGYGFTEAQYTDDSETSGVSGIENSELKQLGRTWLESVGDFFTNKYVTKDYLKAYIMQNEAIYTLSIWNWAGLFQSFVSGGSAEEYSKGMINISVDDQDIISEAAIKSGVSVDRNRKMLRIRMGGVGEKSIVFSTTYYYFNMANWLSRYGKPLELFLALHLSTMMPDLAYDLATAQCFNTKVNIDLQTVNSTYEVSYDGIQQEEIQKTYLKSKWSFNDQDINYTGEDFQKFYDYVIAYSKSINYKPTKGIDLTYIEKQMKGENPKTEEEDYDEVPIDDKVSSIKNYSDYTLKNISSNNMKTDIIFKEIAVQREEPSLGGGSTNSNSNNSSSSNNNSDNNDDDSDNNEKPQTTRKYNTHTFRGEVSDRQSVVDGSNLSGLEVKKLDALIELVDDGKKNHTIYWPRIKNVINHWYYKEITYTYGKASKAIKRINYEPEDSNNALYNVEGIVLTATFSSDEGVYYQLCEPEAEGPNDAIVALFKGGSGSLNGVNYSFDGKYYRYDGTRDTAKKITNAKSGEGGYIFGGKSYSKEPVSVYKEPVVFYDSNNNNSYKNAFTAFAILENSDTQEAEAAYRNLKELLVTLNYFSEDELKDPITQVLDWIMPDNLENKNVIKDPNKYGIIVKNSSNKEIIAPGDGEVISVGDDSVTIQFTTLNPNRLKKLNDLYTDKLFFINDKAVVDMQMVIVGINSSVTEGQKITLEDTLGTAKQDEVQVYMKYRDGSIVDDISKYMVQRISVNENKLVDLNFGNKK